MVPLAALVLALPSSAVLADTATTSTVDCGSAPTIPSATATVQERQQYHDQVAQYRLCMRTNNQNERTAIKDEKQQLVQDHCTVVTQRIDAHSRIRRPSRAGIPRALSGPSSTPRGSY